MVGSNAHRAIARQAVTESMVLLKNERDTLPLDPGQGHSSRLSLEQCGFSKRRLDQEMARRTSG